MNKRDSKAAAKGAKKEVEEEKKQPVAAAPAPKKAADGKAVAAKPQALTLDELKADKNANFIYV